MKDFHLSMVICFCFHLCSYFSDPPGSWVMLCFYTFYTLPRLLDLFLIRLPDQPLIIHKHPVLCTPWSCLWTVWYFVLQPYYPSSVPLLPCQSLYFWSCISSQSLFLIPYLHGIFQHSILLLTLPLSLSMFLDCCFFHPGCCEAHWLPFHLAPLNFSATINAVISMISMLGSNLSRWCRYLLHKLFLP